MKVPQVMIELIAVSKLAVDSMDKQDCPKNIILELKDAITYAEKELNRREQIHIHVEAARKFYEMRGFELADYLKTLDSRTAFIVGYELAIMVNDNGADMKEILDGFYEGTLFTDFDAILKG